MPFTVRHYQTGDHLAVAEAFTRAIHETAAANYEQAQRDAWAPRSPSLAHWRARCAFKRPFLAVDEDGVVAAFLELDHDGHIDCTYTHPAFARQGAMTVLYEHAERLCREVGVERLWAEVSLTAQPFFIKQGWRIVEDDTVTRQGVSLPRHIMDKLLS
jgi:putative acetyltransferase